MLLSPPEISATSVLVPPISNVMMSGKPDAVLVAIAPTIPAAGPDSTVRTGPSAATSREMIPPFDWVI